MSAAPPTLHLSLYRVVFGLVAMVVPLAGLMPWETQGFYDSMAVRLGFAAFATGGFAATWVPAVRPHTRLALQALGLLLTSWFTYLATLHRLSGDDVLGLLLILCIAPSVVARRWELALVAGTTFAVTAIGAFSVAEPAFPPLTYLVLATTLTLGLGLASLSKSQTEACLEQLARHLDARVEERTEALRGALERAEREAADRKVAEANAVKASQAKSRFLANMSHELRTPLNAILGYSEMVEEELDERGEDALAADLGHVQVSANHLLGLIDDVLDLSRIEAEELPMHLEELDVAQVVEEAIAQVPSAQPTAHRELEVAVPELRVLADAQRLAQVLVNLLDNAAKFTDQGAISLLAERDGERVRLSVRDTGPGIEASLLPRVFDRFLQGDDAATRVHGGVGLGLTVSRMLVERMNGRIEVASELGQGATFSVWLPSA